MAIITAEILTKAIIVRLFFFLHAVLCVWRVVLERNTRYWAMLLIPLLLPYECALTLKYSRLGEWET